MVSKRLFVFCDGDAHPSVTESSNASNVFRLFCSVKNLSRGDRLIEQIAFYQSGYELGLASDGFGVTSSPEIFGMKMGNKIRDAYSFISQNFRNGDEVFLFGFSSGAYAVRKLIELIDDIGVLEPSALGYFFKIWRTINFGDSMNLHSPPGTRRTRIRCVGLWDTVGTVYESIDALALKHPFLSPSVDIALHALSFQENRSNLAPTLWRVPTSRWGSRQIQKEVWFPGSHDEIGGMYERHEFADISLFWMVGEILDFKLFNLDANFIRQSKQSHPDIWNDLHSSDTARAGVEVRDRLSTGHITRETLLHCSCVAQKPQNDPQVLTHQTLQNTFERLVYADMNRFENECSAHWDEEYMEPLSAACTNVSHVSQLFVEEMPGAGSNGAAADPITSDQATPVHGKSRHTPQWQRGCDNTIRPQAPTRWIRVEGVFSADKLNGLEPVMSFMFLSRRQGGDVMYITQAYRGGELYEGTVREGQNCLIVYNGKEISVDIYNVKVICPSSCLFNHGTGQVLIPSREWSKVGKGEKNSKVIQIGAEAISSSIPRVLVGLNVIDLDRPSNVARIKAYVDELTKDHFTTHIDTWDSSTLYNGGISWLRLSAADPGFECGVHEQKGEAPESTLITFDWKFENPPNVFVGLCGFSIQSGWRLSVSATDISRTGFRLYVDAGVDTTLFSCSVTWVAFPADRLGVSHGTFGMNNSNSLRSGTISFTSVFKRPPMIFTALQSFDIGANENLRLRAETGSVTNTGLSWKIDKWWTTVHKKVRMAYLALDPED